uniref:Uncharacterized protein n=1 Tax=virus sp. ctoYX9 TaxID=2825822 RepID=A0A8S5RPC0_9VIRU|nr:MAG TPA: hypothetical protein [virus sp. ctoYX9]
MLTVQGWLKVYWKSFAEKIMRIFGREYPRF